jgi:competence protein ComGC
MRPRLPDKKTEAWSLIEALLVILVLAVLAAMLLRPVYQANHQRTLRIGCENNLRQICHAYGFWENYQSERHTTLNSGYEQRGNHLD